MERVDDEVDVYLSLGTNVGNKWENLQEAVYLISKFESSRIINVSSVYETSPWGYLEQDNFYNLCIHAKTLLSPHEYLDKCQEVEDKLKRTTGFRWGPRTIDVDILLFGDYVNQDKDLTIPHPHMLERGFVLIPLLDLERDLLIKGKSIREWYEELDEGEKNSTLRLEGQIYF